MLASFRKRAKDRDGATQTLELYYASDVHGSDQCWRKFLGAGRFYERARADHGRRPHGQGDRAHRARRRRLVQRELPGRDPPREHAGRARPAGRRRALQRHVPVDRGRRRDRAPPGRRGGAHAPLRAGHAGRAAALDRPGRRAHGAARHRGARDGGQRRPVELRRRARGGHARPVLRRSSDDGRRPRDDLVLIRQPDAVEQPARAGRGRAVRAHQGAWPISWSARRPRSSTCTCRRTRRASTRPTRSTTSCASSCATASPTRCPVGSTAVRQILEEYQPLLALHGHIHESRGAAQIGRTLALNSGIRVRQRAHPRRDGFARGRSRSLAPVHDRLEKEGTAWQKTSLAWRRRR